METTARDALVALWSLAGLPPQALAEVTLTGCDPVFPSSFAVARTAQVSIAAAALAACELGHARGVARQGVAVDAAHAAAESTGWFSLDGKVPELWDPFAGLYPCADGHVRIHTNFRHHRDGALRLLGLDPQTAVRADVERAMLRWKALDFEQAAADRGLVATALRNFAEWDATPQGQAVAAQPVMTLTRIGDAPPLALPTLADSAPPLAGVRVLDLTRILAGPVGGRTLAAFGADVMLVTSPNLPNIDAIADSSRSKRSAHVDLPKKDAKRCGAWSTARMSSCRATGRAAWPRGDLRLRRWPRGGQASSRFRSAPMGRKAPGQTGAASTRWSRRPWDSITPKARQPATASLARYPCRYWTKPADS